MTFGCTWWEVFTIASSVVAILLTAGRLTSPGMIGSRSEISNQRAFDFCDESGKEKDPPECWLTSLTRLYNPHELKLIQMACFRATKNDTATTWQKQSECWEGVGLFQFGVKNQLQDWTLAFFSFLETWNLRRFHDNVQPHRQCTYAVTLRRVRITSGILTHAPISFTVDCKGKVIPLQARCGPEVG